MKKSKEMSLGGSMKKMRLRLISVMCMIVAGCTDPVSQPENPETESSGPTLLPKVEVHKLEGRAAGAARIIGVGEKGDSIVAASDRAAGFVDLYIGQLGLRVHASFQNIELEGQTIYATFPSSMIFEKDGDEGQINFGTYNPITGKFMLIDGASQKELTLSPSLLSALADLNIEEQRIYVSSVIVFLITVDTEKTLLSRSLWTSFRDSVIRPFTDPIIGTVGGLIGGLLGGGSSNSGGSSGSGGGTVNNYYGISKEDLTDILTSVTNTILQIVTPLIQSIAALPPATAQAITVAEQVFSTTIATPTPGAGSLSIVNKQGAIVENGTTLKVSEEQANYSLYLSWSGDLGGITPVIDATSQAGILMVNIASNNAGQITLKIAKIESGWIGSGTVPLTLKFGKAILVPGNSTPTNTFSVNICGRPDNTCTMTDVHILPAN